MDSEFQSLSDIKRWVLVHRPSSTNVNFFKRLFKVKEEQKYDGSPTTRYNAQLVARCFSQVKGVDFSETYAPVIKFTSVRTLLSIMTNFPLYLHQMVVVTALPYGKLDEEIYMEQPEGYENGNSEKIGCRLVRFLCFLKQAPRQWIKEIDAFLRGTLGMTSNTAGMCLYVRHASSSILLIAVHVEDLLIASSSETVLEETKRHLGKQFKLKVLGSLEQY